MISPPSVDDVMIAMDDGSAPVFSMHSNSDDAHFDNSAERRCRRYCLRSIGYTWNPPRINLRKLPKNDETWHDSKVTWDLPENIKKIYVTSFWVMTSALFMSQISTFWIKPVKIVYITNLPMESERKIVGKWLTPHFDHNKCPFKKNDIWLHDVQHFLLASALFAALSKIMAKKSTKIDMTS